MKMTKYSAIAITSIALVAGLVGTMMITSVYAEDNGPIFTRKLATKLGVSEEKVQSAVQELREERHTQMMALHAQELEAVSKPCQNC